MASTSDEDTKTIKWRLASVFLNLPSEVSEYKIKSCSSQSVPYAHDFDGPLRIGQLISVDGYIPNGCHSFSINLTCGRELNADIAFHFNPRLEQKYIVRNCRINGHWGEEETGCHRKYELWYDKKFDVDIFVAEKEFMVSVNGFHYCAFTYRIPLKEITAMDVRGGVDVNNVTYRELTCYPENCGKSYYPVMSYKSDTPGTKEVPTPFTAFLPRMLSLGWEVEVTARVKILPRYFYINLQEGSQYWPHPMIPIHLNPRFCSALGDNVFVRNAWYDGEWGPEEMAPVFPFQPGSEFILFIRREHNHFSVWVNKQLVGEFRFRTPVDKIDCIYIQGDIGILKVEMGERKIDYKQAIFSQ